MRLVTDNHLRLFVYGTLKRGYWNHQRFCAQARRQQEIGTPRFGRPTGDWDLIHGELVTFTDPQRDLPPTCPRCRAAGGSTGWKDFGPPGTACTSG